MRFAKSLRNGLVGLVAVLAPAVANAQEPVVIDPEANLAGELIVKAADVGPAWWKVADADSTVWIMGVPTGGLPRSVKWETIGTERRLHNAKLMLLPPDFGDTNIFSLVFFMITHMGEFRSKDRPLSPSLPPELRDRYIKVRDGLGLSAQEVEPWQPAFAGWTLAARFQRPLGLRRGEPVDDLRGFARRARVRQERIAGYDFMPAFRSLAKTSPEAQMACIEASLAQIEAGTEPMLAAARGWAEGDVRAAVSAERGADRCTASLPEVSVLTQKVMIDTAAAIAKALDTPGKTVAIVELRPLLAENGVIQRLQARGLEVVSPAVRQEVEDGDIEEPAAAPSDEEKEAAPVEG